MLCKACNKVEVFPPPRGLSSWGELCAPCDRDMRNGMKMLGARMANLLRRALPPVKALRVASGGSGVVCLEGEPFDLDTLIAEIEATLGEASDD